MPIKHNGTLTYASAGRVNVHRMTIRVRCHVNRGELGTMYIKDNGTLTYVERGTRERTTLSIQWEERT